MPDELPKLSALHAVFGLDCPYSGHERQVAAVLILDHNEHKGGAYRGLEGIAKRAGLSRRQAARATKSLVSRSDGPLVVTSKPQARKDGAGGRAPNLYTVRLRAPQASNQPVECPAGTQPERGLSAKTTGVECQNDGGLSAHQAQDRSRDRSRDRIKAHYLSTFEASRGCRPTFTKRDSEAVAKLIGACGSVERACAAITGAFRSWKAATVTIRQIAADPSQFLGEAPGSPAADPEWEEKRARVLAATDLKLAREAEHRNQLANARGTGGTPEQGREQIVAIKHLANGVGRAL